MKVFKFGGASVKDAEGVKNIVSVLQHKGFRDTLIVVSAMGKTTNALEQVVHSINEMNIEGDFPCPPRRRRSARRPPCP